MATVGMGEFERGDDPSEMEQLIDAARQGGHDAINRLLKVASVYCRLCAVDEIPGGLTSKFNPSDVGQESALDVFRGIAAFRGGSREFYSWLRRIVRNNVVDLQRKHRMAADLEVDCDVDPPARPCADPVEGEDLIRRMANVLSRLPEDRAEVLVLRIWENLPWDEVGRRMARSGGAALHLFARALGDARIEMRRAGLVPPPDNTP